MRSVAVFAEMMERDGPWAQVSKHAPPAKRSWRLGGVVGRSEVGVRREKETAAEMK